MDNVVVLHKGRPTDFDGPISSILWKKVKGLDSSYPDTFDWSVYDRLQEKFGPNPPRGGILFKTNFKLVNHHSSCSKCHYAFEIDTYGRGCVHNCIYCYAKENLTRHGYWNRPHPMPLDISEVRKIFYIVFETDKKNKWREILEKKIPLRIGSMSDSFMLMDKKYKVTLEFLKILKFYRYPYIIFTRSDLVADDAYIEVMDRDLAAIQMSICGGDEKITRLIEPGAHSLSRRLSALKKLAEEGFWTTVRVNPLFPTWPDGYYTDRNSITGRFGPNGKIPRFDLLDLDKCGEFLDQLVEAKVPSLLAGFVRLTRFAISSMSKATGIDFNSFFRMDIPQDTSDKRYTDKEISYYYGKLHAESIKRKLRFSTCYIGNGVKDYFQYQDKWNNKKDCCDAIGQVKGFGSSCQEIPWKTRLKHSPCKDGSKAVEKMDKDAEKNLVIKQYVRKNIIEEFNLQ